VEDFIDWIEDQFSIIEDTDLGRRRCPSDGRLVRNAFRLVAKLGLTGMPSKPSGPFTISSEQLVLWQLQQRCFAQGANRPAKGESNPTTPLPWLQVASNVPDLGKADTLPEFWDWCSRQREALRRFRVRLGEPPPACVATDEFRLIPEVVLQCRRNLLGFGAGAIPDPFTFSGLPRDQTPTGPEHSSSPMENFLAWASGYHRAPQHGIIKLIGEVEEFLTWAMAWAKQRIDTTPSAGLARSSRKKPIPRDEANILIRDYLKQHPNATVKGINKATGVSTGAISQSPAWQALQATKKSGEPTPSPGGKTIRLTNKMLEAVGKKADPSARITAEEAAWQYLLEKATPEERARLHAMKPGERAENIRLVIEQLTDESLDEE
jgi:hypothetical protein